jgi:hypothetical protein
VDGKEGGQTGLAIQHGAWGWSRQSTCHRVAAAEGIGAEQLAASFAGARIAPCCGRRVADVEGSQIAPTLPVTGSTMPVM